MCRKQGEGFVEYLWPKYDEDEPQPKLSFVKHFPEWDWVIGTGVYLDETAALIHERQAEVEKRVEQAEATS